MVIYLLLGGLLLTTYISISNARRISDLELERADMLIAIDSLEKKTKDITLDN